MTNSLLNTNFNGITPEIKEILDECPNSAQTGYVYYSEETHKMEPELLKTWEAFVDKYEETGPIMKHRFGKRQSIPIQ
mgnify:CR=1 FL=1